MIWFLFSPGKSLVPHCEQYHNNSNMHKNQSDEICPKEMLRQACIQIH